MTTQYMLVDEKQFDFDYMDALSTTYEVQPELVQLPVNVHIKTNITREDLKYGLANARPIQL